MENIIKNMEELSENDQKALVILTNALEKCPTLSDQQMLIFIFGLNVIKSLLRTEEESVVERLTAILNHLEIETSFV